MENIHKNSLFNFLTQILGTVLGFIISVILARFLGSEKMGQYSFLMQLGLTISLIFTLSLPTVLARFIAIFSKQSSNLVKELASWIFKIELILSVSVTLVLLLLIKFVFNLDSKNYYYLVILSVPFIILNNYVNGLFQGLKKYSSILKVNTITLFINLMLTVVLIYLKASLFEILILNLFVQAFSFCVSFLLIRDYIKWKVPKLKKDVLQTVSKYTFSTSIIVILNLVLMDKSEVFFLKAYSKIDQIAFYTLAFSIVSKFMLIIPGSISGVILPVLSGHFSVNDTKSINATFYKTTRLLILCTLPIMFGGIVLSDIFVKLIYGNEYLQLSPILQVLLVSGGLSAIIAAASSVLYAIGKQKVILIIGIITVFLNLSLDFLLIPKFAAIGAALANSIAQTTGVILGLVYVTCVLKLAFPFVDGFKILLSAIAGSLVIFLLKQVLILPLLMEFVVLSGVFLFVIILNLMILNFFNKEDKLLYTSIKKTLWKQ